MFREAAFRARNRPEGVLLLRAAPRAWMFTLLLFSVVASLFLLLLQGEFGRSHVARGALVPSTGMVKVYANAALTVQEFLCEEGDHVAAGAPLIRLIRRPADAKGNDIHRMQLEIVDRRIRLRRDQLRAADASFSARDSQLVKQIEGIERQSAHLSIQSNREALLIASLDRQLANLRTLLDNRLISEMSYEERRRAKLASEAAAQDAVQEKVALVARVQMLGAERAALRAQRANDRLIGESEILSLETQRIVLSQQQAVTIVAPKAGFIHAIHIDPGQLASTQRPLLSLFPADALLEAEIYVPGRAVAALRVAQRLNLKYDAFPFARFGGYTARVSKISYAAERANALDESSPLREPVYRVRAGLDMLAIEHNALSFRLQPGMTFTTSIMAERRALLELMLLPFRRVAEVYWPVAVSADKPLSTLPRND